MKNLSSKNIFLFLLIFILCIVASYFLLIPYSKIRVSSPDHATTDNSIIYQTRIIDYQNRLVNIHLAQVQLGRINIGIRNSQSIGLEGGNRNGYTLKEYMKLENHRLVHSGGFFSSLFPPTPLGFVKVRGKEYSSKHSSWLTTGMLCSNGTEITIGNINDVKDTDWKSCLQAGHLILENGKIVINTDRKTWYTTGQPHTQSFVCIDEDDFLQLGITDVIDLKTLVRHFLVKPKKHGGLGCKNAIAMSGGDTAGMITKDDDQLTTIGSDDVLLPNVIVID